MMAPGLFYSAQLAMLSIKRLLKISLAPKGLTFGPLP